MKKIFILSVFMLFFSGYSASGKAFSDINPTEMQKEPLPSPQLSKAGEADPGEIKIYKSHETFPFENRARAAMNEKTRVFKNAGIKTIGGSVIEEGNDYTYVIEYFEEVDRNSPLPPAVIIKRYENGKNYWRKSEAEEERNLSSMRIKKAGLALIDSGVYEKERDYGFFADYAVKNILRRSRNYRAEIKKYVSGDFTFESQAEKAAGSYKAVFQRNGIPVINARAVEKSDGNYAVEVEYAVKTNKYGERPLYSVKRYFSPEVFPFENRALEAGRKKLPVFERAGILPLSVISAEKGNDYSFAMDYLVKNKYRYNQVKPSVEIRSYESPETFDFRSQAEKAMKNKVLNMEEAGLPVISALIVETGGGYSFAIEYAAKN